MNLKEVKERVSKIGSLVHDDESAHSEEDILYKLLLSAIASGNVSGYRAKRYAQEALKTQIMGFCRWKG